MGCGQLATDRVSTEELPHTVWLIRQPPLDGLDMCFAVAAAVAVTRDKQSVFHLHRVSVTAAARTLINVVDDQSIVAVGKNLGALSEAYCWAGE